MNWVPNQIQKCDKLLNDLFMKMIVEQPLAVQGLLNTIVGLLMWGAFFKQGLFWPFKPKQWKKNNQLQNFFRIKTQFYS